MAAESETKSDKKMCPDCGARFESDKTTCPHDGSFLVDDQPNEDPLIGKTIDNKYHILSKLGGGGFGAVYRAEHKMMNRTVALKVLHHHLLDGDARNEFLVRFQREARTSSKIEHPNAITIHDFGIFENSPYLVMQYVEGRTLKQVINDHGALSIDRVVAIVEQVSGAIGEAHELGIVHRDLKPDNIILSSAKDGTERAIVLDFGIAKIMTEDSSSQSMQLTQTGTITGTPQYLSPEQARQSEIDGRSDIYSLGIITYEMLTGQVPFTADSVVAVLMKHMSEAPPRFEDLSKKVNIKSEIEEVVRAALEKEPDKRPATVSEFASALANAAGINPGTPVSFGSLIKKSDTPATSTPSLKIEVKVPPKKELFGLIATAAVVFLVGSFFVISDDEPGTLEAKEHQINTSEQKPEGAPDWVELDNSENPSDPAQASADNPWQSLLSDAETEKANKNWDKAAELYTKAIEMGADDAEIYFKQGDVLINAGKLQQAAESFRAAVSRDPLHENSHASLGYVYGELGNLDSSLNAYKNALEISPEKPLLHNNVGFTLFKMKKYEEAKKAYGQCLKIDKTYSRCIYNLADIFKQEKSYDKVATLYQLGLKSEPDNALVHYALGETHEKLGQKQDAIKSYQEALRLDPNLRNAQKRLSVLGAR